MFARLFASHRCQFSRQQVHDQTVLVGRPNRPVPAKKTRPSAFLAAKAERTVEQPGSEPFEPNRHLTKPAAAVAHHPVNNAAADQCFADGGLRPPIGTMGEQVTDRHGQEMVRVHQARRRRDDAVAVRVWIVAEGDAVLILQADQPGHGVWARTIHPDLPVMVHRHEREGRIELGIDDRDVQAVASVNRLPIGQRRAAKRIHGQLEPRSAYGRHVHHVFQILDVWPDQIFLMRSSAP